MTTNSVHLDIERRHDFVLLFDVMDGNPNGDPDAGNLPRVDPETMQGLVTDVAIKRRIRNFVDVVTKEDALYEKEEERYKIYVQERAILNEQHRRAYSALSIEPKAKGKDQPPGEVSQTRKWMCENFYDIRAFGAVMSTDVNCGQVRGPVQLTFARSIDAVVPCDLAITRVAVTKPGENEGEEDDGSARSGTMGRKALVPYALFRANGFFSPAFARDTGFDTDDLSLLWRSLAEMWDLNRSASRGLTACRGLYVFSHDKPLGNAPAHKLFERVTAKLIDNTKPPRAFTDYTVTIDDSDLPTGVTLTALVAD